LFVLPNHMKTWTSTDLANFRALYQFLFYFTMAAIFDRKSVCNVYRSPTCRLYWSLQRQGTVYSLYLSCSHLTPCVQFYSLHMQQQSISTFHQFIHKAVCSILQQ